MKLLDHKYYRDMTWKPNEKPCKESAVMLLDNWHLQLLWGDFDPLKQNKGMMLACFELNK